MKIKVSVYDSNLPTIEIDFDLICKYKSETGKNVCQKTTDSGISKMNDFLDFFYWLQQNKKTK